MLQGRRIAVLIEDGFEVSATVEFMRALKEAGAKVFLIGDLVAKGYRGDRDEVLLFTDDSAGRVSAFDFDAVIVPGGQATHKMCQSKDMLCMISEACHAGRIVAAICQGPQLLASAGILTGKRVTCCPEIREEVIAAGAKWLDKPIVRDGNIITARKAADIPKFNKAIVEALC